MHQPSSASIAVTQLPTSAFKAGERTQLPSFVGSADALHVAQLAGRSAKRSLLTVITADAGDAQRLLDEILWFAPDLRVRLFPTGKHCPTTVSRRIMTLSRTSNDCLAASRVANAMC